MAYIKYKLQEGVHEVLREVCKKLGMKESEVSRQALMEYLQRMSVISAKVKEKY